MPQEGLASIIWRTVNRSKKQHPKEIEASMDDAVGIIDETADNPLFIFEVVAHWPYALGEGG
jgi:hypothetical protein